MARDENDRSFDDGQGRPGNPDLTGDVLSPRWSTDDTDEQPAVQVAGNDTYILPPDNAAPSQPQAEPAYAEGVYEEGLTGSYDDSQAPAYTGDEPSDPRRGEDVDGYLPLDRAYEEPEEQPRAGFLGSGWTGATEDDHREGEVRRRTRLLLAAAAAVVVLGVGAGWMFTGATADDPCAGGRCAGVGDLSTPSADEEPEADAPIDEAIDTATPEPSATRSETPATTPPTTRVRPTRTAAEETDPEPRPTRTRTRTAEPQSEPTSRETRSPVDEIKEAETSARPEPRQTEEDTAGDPVGETPTEAPEPEETRRGLFDILFPWA
ncbi:hypothetical protein [Nonomuraea sp. NPDC048826]|uniref:hypothetical protein n=1 Tax=Nonomuraea sp. NPDC048826 TaxID=3364347 RepID=UPI0037185E28